MVLPSGDSWWAPRAAACKKATASSIQFNIPRQDGNIKIKGGKVEISLENHFFRTITESVTPNVEVTIITYF